MFNYIEKIFVLNVTTGGLCIISHATVVGAHVGIASAWFIIVFSLAIGIVRKILKTTRHKKKKHDKILMLAESKLNTIETLVSQALIDMEISHAELKQFWKKGQVWVDERKCEESEWEIRRKTRKYETK